MSNVPALSLGPFHASVGGLEISGMVPFELWAEYGKGLQVVHAAIHFVIGDWLIYGEEHYGDAYAQALAMLPYDKQTLMNDKFVASHIPPERRRIHLTHSHHAAVAPLPPNEQDEWLERAEEEEWTRQELRAAMRPERGIQDGLIHLASEARNLRVRAEVAADIDTLDAIIHLLRRRLSGPSIKDHR